jgi:hypothetical protein
MSTGWCFRARNGYLPAFLAVLMPLALAMTAPIPVAAQAYLPGAEGVLPNIQPLPLRTQDAHPSIQDGLAAIPGQKATILARFPAPGSYPDAVLLDPAFLDSPCMFRYSTSSPWRPFDRILVLDAFPGEQRPYRLELLSTATGEVAVLDYVVDRQPPDAPTIIPVSGDAGDELTIGLRGEGSLMLSLDGEPFSPFDPEVPIRKAAPSDGSSIITALAYAIDEHGNASSPSFAMWRLSSIQVSSLPSFDPGLKSRPGLRIQESIEGLSIRIVTESGTNPKVLLDIPVGRIPVIALQPSNADPSAASFIRLSPSAGRASAEIPVPWGYDLDLTVRYGYEDEAGLVVSGNANSFRAEFPFREPPAPPSEAPAPVVSTSFGAVLVSWPPSINELYLSMDGSEYTRYLQPLLLPYRGAQPYELSYQAANDGGRSDPVSLSVRVLPPLEAPVITGVEPGRSYGVGPAIQAAASYGTVRYEMTTDGSEPPPPGSSSPAIDGASFFQGIAGQHVQYRLRLASVDDEGIVGPERFLDFSVDREAPSIPAIAQALPSYSADDLVLSLETLDDDAAVFLSISDDGTSAFQKYDGPVVLAGSDEGRKRYVVRAFSEDDFGNRSEEMQPVTVLVDRSSLYIDPAGRSGAAGTPDDPLSSLQEALQVSRTTGRKILYLRGNHVLASPIQIDGNLKIFGGFTSEWAANQQEPASIRFSRPLASGTAGLRILDGQFEMRSVGIVSEGTGVSVLIDARNASLVLGQVSLAVSGGLEATVIKLQSSQLVVDGADISISSVVTGRALDSLDSDCRLDRLAITGDSSVRLFDALRIVGGQSTLTDLRLDASPGLAFSGLSLSKARVSMSGCALFVKGGASTLRLVNLNAADLTADTLFGDVVWLGEAELFRLGSSSNLRLAHATILAKAKRLSIVEYRDSSWKMVNSIINADSPAAVFASGNSEPQAGSVGANCLWGFSAFLAVSGGSGSLATLNAYSVPGYPSFVEAPTRTFASANKGLPRLSPSSACVGNAVTVPWTLPDSLQIKLRAPVSRDIGVDGLQEGRL